MGDIEIIKSPSNAGASGYIRSKAEVSPDRRQEYKRLRKESGGAHRVPSSNRNSPENALSHAVQNSLTLEERVVGRERQGTTKESSLTIHRPPAMSSAALAPGVGVSSDDGPRALQSPSGVMQGRSRTRGHTPRVSEAPAAAETEAAAALSGLAALSTAAFLKLDEAN